MVNGTADISGGTTIFGNLYANNVTLGVGTAINKVGGAGGNVDYTGIYNEPASPPNPAYQGSLTTPSTKTFATIAMASGVGFSATGPNQQVDSALDLLALAPGPSSTYGSLSTSQQSQTVRLSSGDYYFSSLNAQAIFTLEIDLSTGQPINLNIVNGATFAQDPVLKVKGAGTGGSFVPINQAPELAEFITWTLGGRFDLGGGDNNAWTSIFGGMVYSAYSGAGDGIVIDQRVDWYGALHAFDTINIADHGRYSFVSSVVPEPTAPTFLLGSGLLVWLIGRRRRN